MDPRGPPLQYPRPRTSLETERTIAGSAPASPREEIPSHVFEGEPPLYGDAPTTTPEGEKARRRKERRTTCVKFATSIFIAVIVCLVAAAVIGKIHDNQARKYAASASTTSENNSTGSMTTPPIRLTIGGEHTLKVPVTTSTTLLAASTSQPAGSSFSIECPCRNRVFPTAKSTSTAALAASTCTAGCETTSKPSMAANVKGYAMFSFHGCILTRTAYEGDAGDLSYECSVLCGGSIDSKEVTEEVVEDDWVWDCV